MNIVLWVVQGLLAAAYVLAGGMKLIQPIDALGKRMDWVRAVPPALVRSIGAAETLGAIGLILPMVTRILPGLTVAAASGLVLVQLSAASFHLSRGEGSRVPGNVVLLLLAVFVVIGRLAISPVA
jgi:hypothetical protein